jgi:hypothetical protein
MGSLIHTFRERKEKDKRDIIDGKTERQGRRGKKKITNEDMRI